MAKGKKKTKGLNIAMPAPMGPDQMLEYSAKSLMRDAMEASPGFKSATGKLKTLAKKLVRGARAKAAGGE